MKEVTNGCDRSWLEANCGLFVVVSGLLCLFTKLEVMLPKLGKLEKVDIRETWKNEASEFTPWLAKEENIALLGDAIGIELEVVEEESSVGLFRADILCRDTEDGHFVLIENQLDRTDHSHLGQILTYAAGLDAFTIVWIAKKFTEEHRAALDWLNDITDSKINFFGIEVEVYRIGDSLPAPHFKIVSKPNEWSRDVRRKAENRSMTSTEELRLEFWAAMKEYFEEKGTFLKHKKPQPNNWMNFAIGKSGFHNTAVVNFSGNQVRVEFCVRTSNAKEDYLKLKKLYESSSYEELGPDLVWGELSRPKSAVVFLSKHFDLSERAKWPAAHAWLLENLEKFDRFFRPKVKALF